MRAPGIVVKARLRAWQRAAAILLGLVVAYVLSANMLLASGLLEAWLSRSGVVLSFRSATTLIPGKVVLRDVRLDSGGTRAGWSIEAARVDADIDVIASLSGRLTVGELVAEGARLRIPADADVGPAPGVETSLPGARAAVGPATIGAPTLDAPALEAEADQIVIREAVVRLDEIRILGFRYEGRATARGSVLVVAAGTRMRAAIALQGGIVRAGSTTTPLARDVQAAIELHREAPPVPPGAGAWRPWSGEASIDARIESVSSLGPLANVRLSGGTGVLSGKLALRRGVVLPGSSIEYEAAEVTAHVAGLIATGALRARFDGEGEALRLEADWRDVRVQPRAPPLLTSASSKSARLVLHTDRDLNGGVHFTGGLEPTKLVIPDLRILNRIERAGVGRAVSGGSGELMVRSRRDFGCAWTVRAHLFGAALKLGAVDLAGDLELDTRLEGRRCAAPEVLTETVLSSTDTTLGPPEHRTDAFSANVRLARVRVDDWPSAALMAKFDARLDSTAPLLRAISSSGRVPASVDLLFGSGDVRAQGVISTGPKSVDVQVEEGYSGRTAFRGRWLKTVELERTLLIIERAPFAAGLELRESGLELQLVGARQWFDSKLATLPPVGGAR